VRKRRTPKKGYEKYEKKSQNRRLGAYANGILPEKKEVEVTGVWIGGFNVS